MNARGTDPTGNNKYIAVCATCETTIIATTVTLTHLLSHL